MNPMVSAAIGALVRWALQGAAVWLVERGVWTQAEAATYVMGASLALLSLGWSVWNKYRGRLALLTALTMPAGLTTENDVKDHIAAGGPVPSVTTSPAVVPTPQP